MDPIIRTVRIRTCTIEDVQVKQTQPGHTPTVIACELIFKGPGGTAVSAITGDVPSKLDLSREWKLTLERVELAGE